MQYRTGSFRIVCQNEVELFVDGVEGIGSGLCYHYSLTIPGLLVLTSLKTGKYIPGAYALTEDQAQELLEHLAPHLELLNGQKDLLTQHVARTMRSLGLFVVYI